MDEKVDVAVGPVVAASHGTEDSPWQIEESVVIRSRRVITTKGSQLPNLWGSISTLEEPQLEHPHRQQRTGGVGAGAGRKWRIDLVLGPQLLRRTHGSLQRDPVTG